MSKTAYYRDLLGFDLTGQPWPGQPLRVACSQCQAAIINGFPTHERWCPNRSRECRNCGDIVPAGGECGCEVML